MTADDAKLPANLSIQIGPALPANPNPIDLNPDSTFIFTGFPDNYSVQPIVPNGYAATEIRYAGASYLNQLIPIDGRGDLTIVLSNQPAAVSGSAPGNFSKGKIFAPNF